MSVDLVIQSLNSLDNRTNEFCQPIAKFLEDHPRLYKICAVAIHIIRASSMYALMQVSLFPAAVTWGLMIGATVLYRAAFEGVCPWKFTIPSMIGAGVIWVSRATLITLIAGNALDSLGDTLGTFLGLLSLISYVGWICYLSHKDIENRLAKNKVNLEESTCTGCQ